MDNSFGKNYDKREIDNRIAAHNKFVTDIANRLAPLKTQYDVLLFESELYKGHEVKYILNSDKSQLFGYEYWCESINYDGYEYYDGGWSPPEVKFRNKSALESIGIKVVKKGTASRVVNLENRLSDSKNFNWFKQIYNKHTVGSPKILVSVLLNLLMMVTSFLLLYSILFFPKIMSNSLNAFAPDFNFLNSIPVYARILDSIPIFTVYLSLVFGVLCEIAAFVCRKQYFKKHDLKKTKFEKLIRVSLCVHIGFVLGAYICFILVSEAVSDSNAIDSLGDGFMIFLKAVYLLPRIGVIIFCLWFIGLPIQQMVTASPYSQISVKRNEFDEFLKSQEFVDMEICYKEMLSYNVDVDVIKYVHPPKPKNGKPSGRQI